MAQPENTTEQELRLRVLALAYTIVLAQNGSRLTGDPEKDAAVDSNMTQDTVRSAKKLWKFVKEDPLAAKGES